MLTSLHRQFRSWLRTRTAGSAAEVGAIPGDIHSQPGGAEASTAPPIPGDALLELDDVIVITQSDSDDEMRAWEEAFSAPLPEPRRD